jgi:hypothetical protein
MRGWFLIVMAACGRIGFDTAPQLRGDGGVVLGGDAQQLPACTGGMQQEPFGAATSISAAAITNGFAVAYIAADGSVRAATFAIAGTTISPITADTQVFGSAQSSLSVVGTAAGLLAGYTDPSGTTFEELTPQLGSAAFPIGLPSAIADSHALASSAGQIGWLDRSSTELDLRYLAHDGTVQAAAPIATQSAAERSVEAYLGVSNAGFVATWINEVSIPNPIEAALIPANSGSGPTRVSGPATVSGASDVRSAWASVPDRILVAWIESGAVRAVLNDGTLTGLGAAGTLGTGSDPRIASDGTRFWLAWRDPGAPSAISAAQVDSTGVATAYTVTGIANATAYDVVAVGTQAWLLALDSSGLELIPLCPP